MAFYHQLIYRNDFNIRLSDAIYSSYLPAHSYKWGGRDFDSFYNRNVDFYSNYKANRKILSIFDGKI